MSASTALILAVVFLVPSTAAQITTPVPGCKPENCDPKAANGGALKTNGDTTKVILFGHFEDLLNQAPLNTQLPDPQQERDINGGFLMPVLDTWTKRCTPAGPSICADFHFKNNEFRMYSSPGLVEYLTEGWRTHQEPGLAADAVLAGTDITLYWYMSAHAVPQECSTCNYGRTARVGVMPQVAVYARMNTGRFEFLGTEIASSANADAVQFGSDQRINLITLPSAAQADDAYEFVVKMKIQPPGIIPSSETANGFLVYINPYQIKSGDNKADNSFQVMQEEWRIRTGDKFRPRIVFDVKDVMQTKASSLSIFEKRMFVRWSFVSVWGSYDLRDASLKLENTGAGKFVDPDKQIDFIILKRSVDHDGHFKPVNATWAIEYGANDPQFRLPDGEYELTASIMNLQETFKLVQKFPFKVVNGKPDVPEIGAGSRSGGGAAQAGGGSAKSEGFLPGFEAAALLAAIAVAGVIAIRRRKA